MKIILASQSPRRKYLLEQMGVTFTQIPSNFEEYFDDSRSVEEVVKELALGKALDVAKDNPDAVVIGSDLIVVLDGKQIGKPENLEEAKQFLRNISDKSHDLLCAVAVVCLNKNYQKIQFESSKVTIDKLSEEFIVGYAATGTTLDKAGGYAIQHPLMRPHIIEINGRLDNIVGMPTNLVKEMLADFDIESSEVELEFDSPASSVLFD